MTNTLLLSESTLCWCLANYAVWSPPFHSSGTEMIGRSSVSAKAVRMAVLRSTLSALLFATAGINSGLSHILSALILAGSIAMFFARAWMVPVRLLAEFELLANGIALLVFWRVCLAFPEQPVLLWLPPFDAGQLSVIALCVAVFLFMIHGGDLVVRGILEKAGGIPVPTEPLRQDDRAYSHGRIIGQVERIVVVLVVMAGNIPALAFFFAAKGLIRSKELESRPMADYFLLGSLTSFLLGLAGGLVLERAVTLLWR